MLCQKKRKSLPISEKPWKTWSHPSTSQNLCPATLRLFCKHCGPLAVPLNKLYLLLGWSLMLDSQLRLPGKLIPHFLFLRPLLRCCFPRRTHTCPSFQECPLPLPFILMLAPRLFSSWLSWQVVMTLAFAISCHAVCIHGTISFVVTHSDTGVECIWKQTFRMLFTNPGNNINGGCLEVWGWGKFCCSPNAWLYNLTWTVLITLLFIIRKKKQHKTDNNRDIKEALMVWSIIIGNWFLNENAWRDSPLPHGKAWITQGPNTPLAFHSLGFVTVKLWHPHTYCTWMKWQEDQHF